MERKGIGQFSCCYFVNKFLGEKSYESSDLAAGDVLVGHCVDGALLFVHGSVRKNLTTEREDKHDLSNRCCCAFFVRVSGRCTFTA
jgi:hypothetical protein